MSGVSVKRLLMDGVAGGVVAGSTSSKASGYKQLQQLAPVVLVRGLHAACIYMQHCIVSVLTWVPQQPPGVVVTAQHLPAVTLPWSMQAGYEPHACPSAVHANLTGRREQQCMRRSVRCIACIACMQASPCKHSATCTRAQPGTTRWLAKRLCRRVWPSRQAAWMWRPAYRNAPAMQRPHDPATPCPAPHPHTHTQPPPHR